MIKFVLHDLPLSLNDWQNLHPMKKHKLKKQVEHDIYYASYNLRPPKPFEKAKVRIKIFFPTIRRRDNLNYPCKAEIDGLVTAKIIKDDNINVIGRPEVLLEYDKADPRCEIEVWEVD